MDYHVFLLSRIRERFEETGDSTESVPFGIRTSARLITGAALIMVAVFAGFAAGDLVMFQQMGFGLAVAVLIDATLVRTLLLPAAMTLLGRWNWYLPGGSSGCPTSIEGPPRPPGRPDGHHRCGLGEDVRSRQRPSAPGELWASELQRTSPRRRCAARARTDRHRGRALVAETVEEAQVADLERIMRL